MTTADIIAHRLANQGITTTVFAHPQDVVSGLVAMQAQEFAHARWAIGLRLSNATDTLIEQAFNEGAILRTHLMRPTWHFVSPADIRWLLALTAPRVHAVNAYWYRQAGLDSAVRRRCNDVLIKALEGGNYLTRTALQAKLKQAGVVAEGLQLGYLMMQAELDGLICSGPRQGKQFTYALLEERVPAAQPIDRAEALARFAQRYFSTRGPATVQDFAWWSGLSMEDAKTGVASLPGHFVQEKIEAAAYVFAPASTKDFSLTDATFLMPDYDEYGISYKDRSAIFDAARPRLDNQRSSIVYSHMVVVNGRIAGTWKALAQRSTVQIETEFFTTLPKTERQAVEQAVQRYGRFLGKEVYLKK